MDWSSGWNSLKQKPSFLDGLCSNWHVFSSTVPTQWPACKHKSLYQSLVHSTMANRVIYKYKFVLFILKLPPMAECCFENRICCYLYITGTSYIGTLRPNMFEFSMRVLAHIYNLASAKSEFNVDIFFTNKKTFTRKWNSLPFSTWFRANRCITERYLLTRKEWFVYRYILKMKTFFFSELFQNDREWLRELVIQPNYAVT